MPFKYGVFDAHCDTLSVRENPQLEISDMFLYPFYTQIFAICPEYYPAFSYTKRILPRFDRVIRRHNLTKVTCRDDLNNPFCAVLALEGADAFRGSMSAFDYFYKRGMRLLTLTWNNRNEAASSIANDVDHGLTDFGRKIIDRAYFLGVVIDVSHIGDKSFFDVLEYSKNPVVASHSNSRTVNPKYKRNLTDEEFKAIILNRGVVGINLCADFLGDNSNIDTVIDHIEHFLSLGGEKNIGIGTDFDGVDALPDGIFGVAELNKIFDELLKRNYPEDVVKDIAYNNFRRVFSEVLL